LFVAVSVAICAGAHLLLSIIKCKLGWVLWAFCILATVYAHICFFTYSEQHANQLRGEQSSLSIGTQKQIDEIRSALSAITSRPISVISAEITLADNWKIRRALSDELKDARKCQFYRDELIRLQAVATDAKVTTGTDIVVSRIAAVTGGNEANISLGIGLFLAVLLEFFGAFLWYEALGNTSRDHSQNAPIPAPNPTYASVVYVKEEKEKPSVKARRTSFACGRSRALPIRNKFYSTKSQMEFKYE
jgi:hypothetical protein